MNLFEKRMTRIIPSIVEGKLIKNICSFCFEIITIIITGIDKGLSVLAKQIMGRLLSINPSKILFITFQGDYTCNPKYITEELRRENSNYEIVWSSRKFNLTNRNSFPKNIKLVEQFTYDYYKEMASAKIIVANSVEFLKNPIYFKKGQVVIETWHGSLGIKRFGKNENSGKSWVKAAERNGEIADYCISNSKFETKVYRDTYWKHTPVLEYGHPRNDLFFDNYKDKRRLLKQKICELYGIEPQSGIVLYAPTFRDSHTYECYDIEFEKVKIALQEKFGNPGGGWTLLFRYHPTVRALHEKKNKLTAGIDVTDYPDIQELLAITDVAITDYSSWIYDFILLRKPGFIYATDIDEYNNERGFYYPLESTPFPIATNNIQLMENIRKFDNMQYQYEIDLFLKAKGCIEDGQASRRVVELLSKIIDSTAG